MKKPRAQTTAILFLVGLVLFLTGCFEWLGNSPQQASLLIVSEPFQLSSGLWKVTVSVKDMPEGGVSGIQIGNMGITTTDIDMTSIVASGMNSFLVTAQDFQDPAPQGTLIAIQPIKGVVEGKILEFIFRSSGSNPRLFIDERKVVLLSDLGISLVEESIR